MTGSMVAVRRMQGNGAGRMVGALLLGAALWAGLAAGARAEETITATAISTLGNLKYGPDFAHLDYVNPEAPKGGEISEWAPGGFDNFNPYTLEGRAAALSSTSS